MAEADAPGVGADDALDPDGGIGKRRRRQPRGSRCERRALLEEIAEFRARQVIAVHANALDGAQGAQVMEGVGAREDEIGALADSERARAVAEEAPDFARGAAQRVV